MVPQAAIKTAALSLLPDTHGAPKALSAGASAALQANTPAARTSPRFQFGVRAVIASIIQAVRKISGLSLDTGLQAICKAHKVNLGRKDTPLGYI
jgi:hypothetical protein